MQRIPTSVCAVLVLCGCLSNEAPDPIDESPTAEPAAARPYEKTTTPPSDPDVLVFEDFHGVAHLPAGHPCHDDSSVAVIDDDPTTGRVAELTTFGKHRASLGEDDDSWVHLGPRTARGVRWSVGDQHYVLASCNFGGLGFRRYDPEFLANPPQDGAMFSLGHCGECDRTERGDVRLMRRVAEGTWETVWEDVVWAYSDEGNNLEYVARGHVLQARDSDGDQSAELVTYSLRHGPRAEKKPQFQLVLTAREDEHVLRETMLFDTSGKLVSRQRAEPDDGMPPATVELLSAALDQSDEAVTHARAVLTDAKKLNRR